MGWSLRCWGPRSLPLGREGKTSEAQQEVAELREESKSAFVDPYLVSLIYLGIGDEQLTLQWLNRAYVVRSRS